MRLSIGFLGVLAGCGQVGAVDGVAVLVSAEDEALVAEFLETVGDPRIEVFYDPSPEDVVGRARGVGLALVADSSLCEECYRLEHDGDQALVIRSGGLRGQLYGLSHGLEAAGYRFHHPQHSHTPTQPLLSRDNPDFDVLHAPETAVRGLHLHTLHPIEGLFDAWMPSDAGVARMRSVIDWTVRQRANHLQWVALDDISASQETATAWKAHTAKILDLAHARGSTVGLGIQLFGSGNLQSAYDLVDEGTTLPEQAAEMGPRWDLLTDGLDFDVFNLSFGEFFSEDPEAFIASVELAYDQMQSKQASARMTTVLHVGDDLKVEYEGTEWIYYFLATFADRPITHWVHTVMYYNLFEDAGGAYHHEDFDQHRGVLVDAVRSDAPIGYFPESAYWIAFDSSVPQYLPLYMRSRWTDLHEIREEALSAGSRGLQEHVLFSSGWEWGYWQNDVAVLRNNWKLAEHWCDPLRYAFSAHGTDGDTVAQAACDLGEVQHQLLLEERLTPYTASYDAIMELGYGLDIISQPKRTLFHQLVAADEVLLGEMRSDLSGLQALTELTRGIEERLEGLPSLDADPFLAETRDGIALDVVRADFSRALLAATVDLIDGGTGASSLSEAQALLVKARTIVERRHKALHDPSPERLVSLGENPTIYDFGYLLRADELCFWERELAQASNAIADAGRPVPGCAL